VFLVAFLLLCAIGSLSYRGYVKSKTRVYIGHIEGLMKLHSNKFDAKQGIQVEEIIKQTPRKLVLLIKWGENERAYVQIHDWLGRTHHGIEIYPFDMERIVIFN
jgi:hypothetical protein